MDLVATYSREVTGNRFGDNTTIHQGDVHYHSPNDKTREDEDTKCLTDLRTTDPRDDKTRIEATKGGLFKDSYRWILEHSDFRKWRDDERSRLLWIKGDPGKGKTMLLCGIVNELSSGTRLKDRKANKLLSYFFCQAADERINSATAVLRGLIYLIVEQQPLLVSHIQNKYKHGGEALFKDVNAWFALSEIFSNILEDASLERTYVIIDALDECVTDLPKLLDFISTKSALFSCVKWIVSSRNWPDIEERLDSATQQMRLCLELNDKSISAAVNAYIEHQIEHLAQKRKYNASTREAVQHHLSSNSNDTFLWVALVCQNLEKISLQNTLRKLNEFPPGLDSLYKRMMQQIHDLEDVNDTNFCYRLLATVLLVYRPVTLAELGSLVESPDDNPADSESIHKAIGLCGSFLTVRDSQVYVIHQSAKDYLSDKAAPTIFAPSSANVHGVIFSRSLQAMSATLRRNIYNLYSPGLPINKIKALDPDPLKAIRYSCIHWVDHFCDMYNSNSQSQNQVDHEKCQTVFLFLQKYFLYWLEALGLMGYIEDGVRSMARLENLLRGKSLDDLSRELTQDSQWFYPLRLLKDLLIGKSPDRQSPDCQLLELVQDSQRFIRRNSSVIADSPLQVYTSALIFSPLNSLIRKIFKEEEPEWLKVKPTVEYNWSLYLQTLEGHSGGVPSVTFSADGRYLASGSFDKTIKIWDITTGKERQTLKGHSDGVEPVTFSADSRYLASGSYDKTIKIWDITTGKERQTLQGHNKSVSSVAFSADGRYLASGSWDKTIKIWDATTGKERQTLSHNKSVSSVAFSADGRYLASGSYDKSIKIWDATTGKERQTLEGHSDGVPSVTFSADSRYLASGSWDKTIKIWDATTGKERQTLKGHSDGVLSVAFSADSCYLASGSSDNTIKIWDATTGKERQTLKGHSAWVLSVAFSADSRYLASGSFDKTIKIWDTTTGKERQTPKGHSGGVQSVAFSVDGRYLASGSSDKTIKIWDIITGKERQTPKGHSDRIQSVTFSADSRYLASGSWDKTIKIWDATTGKERLTLEGHSGGVESVTFSADGCYLASGSWDKTIKIWDATTGKERQTLKGHSDGVLSVAFSADRRYLASGSSDKTIKIWDATTGKERQTLQGHNKSVSSVSFSADGRYLASGSGDETIKIWDVMTGKERQTLKVNTAIRIIFFDNTASYLHTEIGPIKLGIEHRSEAQSTMVAQVLSPNSDPAQDQDQRQPIANDTQKAKHYGYGLSTDKCWITWNEHNIVWLPPEYQPFASAVWPYAPPFTSPQVPSTDVVIALGNGSGRVVVIRMSRSGPYPLL